MVLLLVGKPLSVPQIAPHSARIHERQYALRLDPNGTLLTLKATLFNPRI